MLVIRLQRLGKTHYATYRIVVQDSHRHPTSGKVVSYLGSYNPHTKAIELNKDEAQRFLSNGAQPTTRVVTLLKHEGVALPAWVKGFNGTHKSAVRNPEKLRKNQIKEESVEAE